MPMNRNIEEKWSNTPTPHFPRNRFDFGAHKKLFTMQHGRLYPFYCQMVYPGDLWTDNPTAFIRADTSLRVPLDDIYLDTYFFFVPFRILDENFAKVLGEKEPYDDNEYSIPQLHLKQHPADVTPLDGSLICSINWILPYLGYSQADSSLYSDGVSYVVKYEDDVTAYPVAAYYKIWNDWFRDEQVDPSFNISDLFDMYCYNSNTTYTTTFDKLNALKVNRFHDYFSSATLNPQRGPEINIPLGLSAPVGLKLQSAVTISDGNLQYLSAKPGTYAVGDFIQEYSGNSGGTVRSEPFIADLSNAAGSINELRLSFAIQSLYERRNRFGTRYIETIRGQWGIDVPDSFFQRPEYLGGSRTTLNNIPVLSTENSSQLGQMSGNSATIAGENGFSKQFIEYGVIIGLCCTRIHHSYGQGKRKELFSLKTNLDLYNPVFANIGYQPIKCNEIYNQGLSDDSVFGYTEAWTELRRDLDTYAGLFGIFSGNNELKNKWHYADYYAAQPVFSDTWLKEPSANVARTMTGTLINGAGTISESTGEATGHQFMIAYYCHPKVTRILPAHSVPVELIGRL